MQHLGYMNILNKFVGADKVGNIIERINFGEDEMKGFLNIQYNVLISKKLGVNYNG